jgi:hypothetical protein
MHGSVRKLKSVIDMAITNNLPLGKVEIFFQKKNRLVEHALGFSVLSIKFSHKS